MIGSIVCFAGLLLLLRAWQPRTVRGYGGAAVTAAEQARLGVGTGHLSAAEVFRAWLPFIVLVVVVVLWTGPWSPLPRYIPFRIAIAAASSIEPGKTVSAAFSWAPAVGGTAIMVSWLLIALLVGLSRAQLVDVFGRTWHQMWGALLVGIFIFGLAYVFNFSGMANSLARGFSTIGPWFIVVAPILGWIGVALSGSNTSTNAMFGAFQASVGKLLGFPLLLLPSLNSVGAEIGKPVAPQTASVGVSTTRFVRNEGAVIRHNMGWTFVLLFYLVAIGVAVYLFFPDFVAQRPR